MYIVPISLQDWFRAIIEDGQAADANAVPSTNVNRLPLATLLLRAYSPQREPRPF